MRQLQGELRMWVIRAQGTGGKALDPHKVKTWPPDTHIPMVLERVHTKWSGE